MAFGRDIFLLATFSLAVLPSIFAASTRASVSVDLQGEGLPSDCMYNALALAIQTNLSQTYNLLKRGHVDEAMLYHLDYDNAAYLLQQEGITSAALRYDILTCLSKTYKNRESSICPPHQGPCGHGLCTIDRQTQAYSCKCLPGFQGQRCNEELNECLLRRPCKNGAHCEDRVNNYTCHCAPGFYGKHCETDRNECASGPCFHGNCIDVVNGYRCECQAGYIGVLCQTDIDECSSDPCQHGGRCQDGVNGFSCICQPGYTGPRCEKDINECSSSPCKNLATCKDGVNSYTCLCFHGYKGRHCETEWLNETAFENILHSNDGKGPTYIRWGRKTCPSTSTLIYNGSAAGSYYSHTGGGANTLCLPDTPQYDRYADYQWGSPIYGAEYELQGQNKPYSTSFQDRDVPCAVCETQGKRSSFMLPARKDCPSGWVREYHGYLMSEHHSGHHRSEYVCVDDTIESIPGRDSSTNGLLFYPVSVDCGYGIACPPYSDARQLTCAVCSK